MYRNVLALAVIASPIAIADTPTHRDDQAPGTAEQVAKGKQLYVACAGCHGAEGEGRTGMAPRLNSASYLAIVSNTFLERTIAEGRVGTNMIPWGAAMPPEDIGSLVAFVRSWQSTDGVELDVSPLTGDAASGETHWITICSRCHGRSGAGYSEAGSGTGIGRKGFLDQITDAELREVIRRGKDNTPMRPFDGASPVSVADLEPIEIDGIIQYLRANAW